MPEAIKFEDFIRNVDPIHLDFVNQTHDFMLKHGCSIKIQPAKNGYVLSYVLTKGKKVIANYVFRKCGLLIRIYGDHIGDYAGILETLSPDMAQSIEKAPTCKRLINLTECNPRCSMGYVFGLGGVTHKKCRYSAFLFHVMDENYAAIRDFLERELKQRTA